MEQNRRASGWSRHKSFGDIQDFYKEMIGEFLERGLEAEMDEELGYSRYDFRNKETDNSRNGHSQKKMKTSFGEVTMDVPRDRKGEFNPQLVKKNQTTTFSTDPDILREIGNEKLPEGLTYSPPLRGGGIPCGARALAAARGKSAAPADASLPILPNMPRKKHIQKYQRPPVTFCGKSRGTGAVIGRETQVTKLL